ncbi:hypothetical protein MLD38_011062 [Melastoma candidum]|uniref:Uncharacterized protein n=1 Tax=Melastoma candidum TaxID=119954 RepID=A0ACB9R1X3_9MYRT|nr:hypothetical protein MLD38_011062 [Melastoma candidum]
MGGVVPPVDINKERIMGELVQGKTIATQLQALLQDPRTHRSAVAHDLMAKILGSFTVSLSVLGSRHPPPKQDWSGTEGNSKRRSADLKEKMGSYKRRKSSQTKTTVTSTVEDGHTWRKYGQKEILNSKFPRSYYRCTNKYDQNCKAIKQVQKSEENPRMYEITYIDVHTCTDRRKVPPPPQVTKGSVLLWDVQSLDVLSRSNNTMDIKDDHLFNSSSTVDALAMKEEPREDAKSQLTDIEFNSLLMGAGDFLEGSSKYQGLGFDSRMDNDSSSDIARSGY